ncbi:hypothetical protein COU96_03335 [Candidatus Shapirobacteria bacterium CG10_big_fil_rev_8_21_14_0_10_38_14]|uniref:Core-binding (CB) domain-containing protein n=1 Tax=Candidatus Shapirobacteria bacterium CG10_big_fil_rev_8_21_14_0_10_38_14 TaxID=1974483 RepID=A0A2M8L4L0_9BACT|nr:MAG: hypothetical protein COU96_03335 [Candidatus Shapirobacteria bacterium CG10_big_fil_rev_8_21_14_0_10_38_14]
MQKFDNLYTFIEFAKNNRKYPENTANNLKSALKIFEKVLTEDELNSVSLLEDRIEEIFISVISSNKNKSIGSLNTYKARVLRILKDYKKYGANPAKIQNWIPATRLRQKGFGGQGNSTPLLSKKDKTDKNQINLSDPFPTPVDNMHKIELTVQANSRIIILLPKNTSEKEITLRILPLDSL